MCWEKASRASQNKQKRWTRAPRLEESSWSWQKLLTRPHQRKAASTAEFLICLKTPHFEISRSDSITEELQQK